MTPSSAHGTTAGTRAGVVGKQGGIRPASEVSLVRGGGARPRGRPRRCVDGAGRHDPSPVPGPGLPT